MSLRTYLFCLVAFLILMLTGTQLLLIAWIDQSFKEEVDKKAQHISKQVIDLAVAEIEFEQIGPEQFQHTVTTQKTEGKTNTVVEQDIQVFSLPSNTDIEQFIEQNKHKRKIEFHGDINQVDIDKLKKELSQLVAKIHDKGVKATHVGENVIHIQESAIAPIKAEKRLFIESDDSRTQNLIHTIELMLLLSAILALILAYWLSVKFNKPLKALSVGFDELSKGNYDTQIPPSGVDEIKQTISHFNNMVAQVKSLTAAEKHNQELKNLAELGDVSRGLAHSLRNPIHTIGLSIEQLLDPNLSTEEQANLINTIKRKISHIDENIKALLTLTTSGIQRAKNVPLLAVIQDIVLEYKACNHKPITFEIDVDSDMQLHGDETEIRHILHALIINACEASHQEGTVIISATQDAGKIHVNVVDQGSGLDEDVAKQLFEPHISSKAEGAGMGLYIAKRLITLHYAGDIQLVNNHSVDGIHGCTATACFNEE